jgi:hypothetical protein
MAATRLSERVVKNIFASDKRIQFCAIVDGNGKIEAGGMRRGVRSLEPTVETEKIVTRIFLNEGINQAIDAYLGRTLWAIIGREKLVQMTFPLPKQKQLQITASLDYPISKVKELRHYMDKLGITD